ncbi:OmpA family protein [Steroidobacter cummioxidans]|uniref:OmpA family protein n=1 Tax=Steroidobacter cummioxidans TaxID=1803913 RepID=UPI000E3113E1|nr:OmpA family protein [Steroidobacter cummioxidans]
MKKQVLIGAMACVMAANAGADEVGRWYFTPQIGALILDDDRNVRGDGDRLFGLAVGKHLHDRWSLELNANGAKVEGFAPYAASLDALRVFRRNQNVSPYVTFGAGAIRNDVDVGSVNTDAMVQAGVGLMWKLGENRRATGAFSVRPEIKARWNDAGHERFLDYTAAVGFQFSFGPAPAAAVVAMPAATEPVAPTPAPAPALVAPADSDGDGVLDTKDLCPETSRGVAVDEKGCPQRGSITLAGVNFENDSVVLLSGSTVVLDRLVADLKKYPQLEIELQGHTDSVGSDQYNQRLSQQRANAVRTYLLNRGIRASQVVARGYGESQPISDNSTAAGRAQNRRVVMHVLQNPGEVEVASP